ncbi:MAG: hypothetical protein V4699_02785 [Patescibacteria group bacterium]
MKQKRYWLRGALIFGLILLPLFFINENNQFLFIPLFIIWTALGVTLFAPFFITVGEPIIAITGHPKFIGFLIVWVFYVLVGIIAGWIYGKIKNRNKVDQVL